jgi:uncharacterized protein YbaP (TraB family)
LRIIATLAVILGLLGPTPATAAVRAKPDTSDAQSPAIQAHPALWHVKGKLGDVYLFGSIHALPPNVQWHTPQIVRAMARADVFVFEVSNEPKALQQAAALVAAHGLLPPGQSLRALLSPATQSDYDADLAAAGVPPELLDDKRPWLASLILTVALMRQNHFLAQSGVDRAVMAAAQAAKKPMRYFETVDQQFALLAPDDKGLELSEFEADLKELRTQVGDLGPLLAAWSRGDAYRIGQLMNADLADHPDAKKALLDDRNRRWALQIETMLLEKRTFFITVGAGHLAGPLGVPARLRKAGYRVTGP